MITLTAYHGTSKINAERILKEGFKNDASSKETKDELARYPNDLGRGVYGYVDGSFQSDVCYLQSAVENARQYAEDFHKVSNLEVAILKMEIQVEDDKALILNDSQTRNRFVGLQQLFMEEAIFHSLTMYRKDRQSRRNQIDGVVLEYLFNNQLLSVPDVVIVDTFTRFGGFLSNISNGIEVAIRNVNVITSLNLVNEEEGQNDL